MIFCSLTVDGRSNVGYILLDHNFFIHLYPPNNATSQPKPYITFFHGMFGILGRSGILNDKSSSDELGIVSVIGN